MKKIITTAIISLISFSSIIASGFQINEHGSKAMAMGGAFTALANDPSAIYFNPAGITQISGTHLIGGTTLIFPSSSFRGPAPAITESKLESQVFTPIHLYATHQFDDKLFFGFGLGNNYGLGTKWEDNWVGRYMAVETAIETYFFNLNASYKVTDEISLGFGGVFAYGNVLIGRALNFSPFSEEGYLELEGTGSGLGFTAGILVQATKAISLGLSYRSEVNIDFEGDATADYNSALEGRVPTGAISAPLTTPQNITFGVAIKPLKELTLTADYQYVGWDSYDKLEVTFNDFEVDGESYVSGSERNYSNSFIARVGAEYVYDNFLPIRLGFLYDSNPVSDEKLDPTLPDSDRLGLSFGLSYEIFDNLDLEAGYLYLRFAEREITNSEESYSGLEGSVAPMNGVYNSTASLFSLTFNYKF